MADARNKWMDQIETFFAAHPEREYLIREMPLAALDAVSTARWVAGSASSGPNDPPSLMFDRAQRNLPCIIRRADPAEGRPLPGVYFMDGGAPLPPLPEAADKERGEELLAAKVWQLAQVATALGVSLITFLSRSLARS